MAGRQLWKRQWRLVCIPLQIFGRKSVTYNDAVEEALCFGWIDSTIKALDKEHKIQHFTPRNPKSSYRKPTKRDWNGCWNIIWFTLIGKIIYEKYCQPLLSSRMILSENWKRIKQYGRITNNFPMRIDVSELHTLAARKRPEEFEKRLNNFINKTKENKMIKGFGGIEKYY